MLPGFSGHLVSEVVLERHLEDGQSSGFGGPALHRDLPEWQKRRRGLGPASSVRALWETAAEPLFRALGFTAIGHVTILGDAAVTTLSGGGPPVALLVTGWCERMDPFWRRAIVEAINRGAWWCVIFNGSRLRLVEAGRPYSQRYVEFDVDLALDDERTFRAMWMLLHANAFSSVSTSRFGFLQEVVEESNRYAAGVCRSLRGGVLDAAREVLGALLMRPPRPPLDQAFEQALTIVYRILFLLFAEARALMPLWHPVYRESYSLEALRVAVEHDSTSIGLWDALRAVSRLAHAGCRAADLRITAFNGRLFAPSRTPLAEREDLDDHAARKAVLALSTRPAPDRAGRERITYRDLGVEQLGAVYETLLDYEPRIAPSRLAPQEARRGQPLRATISLEPGSGLRKATGSFYTPQPIAQYLVRRTLGPLVREASPERILQLRVLDPAMGSGAFLVAACGYLARAYEAALVRSGGCHSSDIGPHEQAAIRRTVAERCLYGVDLNPMAVQLARLSIWLATLAADRPLSFLDHHLATGDSLLGTWLACLRHAPHPLPRKGPPVLPLFADSEIADTLRGVLPVRFTLALEPSDTLDRVREKEHALAALNSRDSAISKWKRLANLWCSQWFSAHQPTRAVFESLSDAVLTGRSALPAATANNWLEDAEAVATARKFFHWELEFPEVFFGADGMRQLDPGFDAVVGNPPWDMIRADAGPGDVRSRAREDAQSVVRFVRSAGVYGTQSVGHCNRYQLFVERAIALMRAGGRLGLVLPSGLATDHGSAPLRAWLFSRCSVEGLVGFDNRQAVFPVHRSLRFLLLTAASGGPTTEFGCRLGEADPAILETCEGDDTPPRSWYPVHVTPRLLERLTGPELAVPDLRTLLDVTIAERAAALFRPLGDEHGWAVRFGRELNATEDREGFRPPGRGAPVVEGKHLEPFRVNLASTRWSVAPEEARRQLGRRFECARVAYRDVAGPSNRLTLIAAVLPPGSVSTHTVFCLRTPLPLRAQHFLCGMFNSFVVNYLVRLRVATHVTTEIVERLPIPRWDAMPAAFVEVAGLARLLSRRAHPVALARLNARVAELYQLAPDEFTHILGTFPLVPIEERDAALEEFVSRRTRNQSP